jgi:hypothetical protein
MRPRLLGALAPLLLLACEVPPFELPPAGGWREYRSATLRVAFDIPDYFEVREIGATTAFRIHGGNAVLLRWADQAERERRGLWSGNRPLGPCTLGGRQGEHFRYNHHDGPVYSVTDACVVPHLGRDLALEFRTTRASAIQERMQRSFRFL